MKFKIKMKLINIGNFLGSAIFLYGSYLAYTKQNYIFLLIGLVASIVCIVNWYRINKALNLIEEKQFLSQEIEQYEKEFIYEYC